MAYEVMARIVMACIVMEQMENRNVTVHQNLHVFEYASTACRHCAEHVVDLNGPSAAITDMP